MASETSKIEAIKAFKDWSNYLLATTIVALGWVAGAQSTSYSCWAAVEIIFLALSAICGILTLALVPLVTQRIDETTVSIYNVEAEFHNVFYFLAEQCMRN